MHTERHIHTQLIQNYNFQVEEMLKVFLFFKTQLYVETGCKGGWSKSVDHRWNGESPSFSEEKHMLSFVDAYYKKANYLAR